jgi:hypothetical protein
MDMKYKLIELFSKVSNGDGTINLIAECNEYEEGAATWYNQLSRSPFTYSESMTDDEIKNDLQLTTYSIYY